MWSCFYFLICDSLKLREITKAARKSDLEQKQISVMHLVRVENIVYISNMQYNQNVRAVWKSIPQKTVLLYKLLQVRSSDKNLLFAPWKSLFYKICFYQKKCNVSAEDVLLSREKCVLCSKSDKPPAVVETLKTYRRSFLEGISNQVWCYCPCLVYCNMIVIRIICAK